MCGIIGVVGEKNVRSKLLEGLQRLEYRGYDSSGIAVLSQGNLEVRKTAGKLDSLQESLSKNPTDGNVGIGHMRWATHGSATETNAHPHHDHRVAVVHNGIIENYLELRQILLNKGYAFKSETDTEVVVHQLSDFLNQGLPAEEAIKQLSAILKGAYALGILIKDHADTLWFMRKGSPLVVGVSDHQRSIASDAIGIGDLAEKIIYLEEGDYGYLKKDECHIFDSTHHAVIRPHVLSDSHAKVVDKGHYRHYMIKEIYEQPNTIRATLASLMDEHENIDDHLLEGLDAHQIDHIRIIACGTSYYAGMIAKYWFEKNAKIATSVDIASEFRYREGIIHPRTLMIFISQSGETLDTLASIEYVKTLGLKDRPYLMGIVNVPNSSIARQVDKVVMTQAGPEIGVASTKAFTSQLVVLAVLSLVFAKKRQTLSEEQLQALSHQLHNLPVNALQALQLESKIQAVIESVASSNNVLYIGRGTNFPLAMEGALKLKEICYVHAEGLAAGELKHGPIALIDKHTKIIILAPTDTWFEKTMSNLQEVLARAGSVICFTDSQGGAHLSRVDQPDDRLETFVLPFVDPFVAPIVYVIPIQLLAYHSALAKGTDVDQPRNLAKSVTVE